jgi:hypothetical protein
MNSISWSVETLPGHTGKDLPQQGSKPDGPYESRGSSNALGIRPLACWAQLGRIPAWPPKVGLTLTALANPDNNFRYDSTLGSTGGNIFNMNTKNLTTGTWQMPFKATGDPVTHTINLDVK